MAKLYSATKIIRRDKKGVEEIIPRNSVFDATVAEAKQYDALKAARPATEAEVKAHDERVALSQGQTFQAPAPSDAVLEAPTPMPDSGAQNDPKSAPKAKSV